MRRTITASLGAALVLSSFLPSAVFAQNATPPAGATAMPPAATATVPSGGAAVGPNLKMNKRAMTMRNAPYRHRHHRRNMYWRTGNNVRAVNAAVTPTTGAFAGQARGKVLAGNSGAAVKSQATTTNHHKTHSSKQKTAAQNRHVSKQHTSGKSTDAGKRS